MRRHLVGLNLVIACLLGAAVSAQESDLAAGKLLYRDNCGTCHGMIESDARYSFPGESLRQLVQAGIMPSDVLTWTLASNNSVHAHRRRALHSPVAPVLTADNERLAVAPPYGPSLHGVYGRQAGSVPGFAYSRAFKSILQGVVWDHGTLDVWIMDSQAWVPGSMMFYKQPNPDIRRKILVYLEVHHYTLPFSSQAGGTCPQPVSPSASILRRTLGNEAIRRIVTQLVKRTSQTILLLDLCEFIQ